jgi:hypothetical protein
VSSSPILQLERIDVLAPIQTVDVVATTIAPHASVDVNVLTISPSGLKADFEVTVIMRYGGASTVPPVDIYVDIYGDSYGDATTPTDTYLDIYGDFYGTADTGTDAYSDSYIDSYGNVLGSGYTTGYGITY